MSPAMELPDFSFLFDLRSGLHLKFHSIVSRVADGEVVTGCIRLVPSVSHQKGDILEVSWFNYPRSRGNAPSDFMRRVFITFDDADCDTFLFKWVAGHVFISGLLTLLVGMVWSWVSSRFWRLNHLQELQLSIKWRKHKKAFPIVFLTVSWRFEKHIAVFFRSNSWNRRSNFVFVIYIWCRHSFMIFQCLIRSHWVVTFRFLIFRAQSLQNRW